MSAAEVQADDFERYFPHSPTALCIRECARLSALRKQTLHGPLLDVGCGDGLFAKLAFGELEVWGIDIDDDELAHARRAQAYSRIISGDITREELPREYFTTCVANCSLEHVPRLDLALLNIFASLRPGGTFLTFVPNASWAEQLLSYRTLVRFGAPSVAQLLQRSVDEFFKHHHLYDADGWRRMVSAAGFEDIEVIPVLSSANTTAYEMFLLPSLVGYFNKKWTKRWTNMPQLRSAYAAPVYELVKAVVNRGDPTPTAEFLVIAKRPMKSGPPDTAGAA